MLFLLNGFLVKSQDTVFVAKHIFQDPVRNVFRGKDGIYVKTGDGVYRLHDQTWEEVKINVHRPFLFYDTHFFEADYIPDGYLFRPEAMKKLIPQDALTNPSIANWGSQFFISVGGSLFEYVVNPFYTRSYKSYSVRDIFVADTFKVVSTYAGIFINDSVKVSKPTYSNGSFGNIGGHYWLCSDELYQYNSTDEFERVDIGATNQLGHIRKLISQNGKIYSQHTFSINRLDSLNGTITIHRGLEYYDIEATRDGLLFCTKTGEVFRYDGERVTQLFDLDTPVRDIYILSGVTYLSTDEGVFTFENDDPSTIKKLLDLTFCVGVLSDALNNLWITTENGLYLLPEGKEDPILFISNVEFNRGALTYHNDLIYAGSISGLYTINIYEVVKAFLPLYEKKNLSNTIPLATEVLGSLSIVLIGGYLFYLFRFKKLVFFKAKVAANQSFSVDQIKKDIADHQIKSVEAMAEFYKTNTVQLNRIFKNFDTTPGKYLKKVKLEIANDLKSAQVPIDEVAARTGYSIAYLKRNL